MTADLTAPEPGRPPRRRWPWVLGGVIVLLVGAGVAADALARGYAQDLVSGQVAKALDVPAGTPVEVQLGGGPLLLQALSGSIDQVDIRVDGLAVGPLIGDLAVTARGVPLDQSAPTRELAVRYTIPGPALDAIADQLSGVPVDSIALDGSEIVASATLSLFGQSVPLGVGLTPSAVDGALAFTPTTVQLGDRTLDAAGLTSDPIWGALAGVILQQQTVCIADQLPAAFTLTGAEVVDDALRVEFDGSGQALGGSGFSSKGSCPS